MGRSALGYRAAAAAPGQQEQQRDRGGGVSNGVGRKARRLIQFFFERQHLAQQRVVRVAAPGGTELTAVSVHLSLKPDERVVHTERILQALSDRGSLIIAGDLNEGDTGAAWRLIDVPDRMRLVSPAAPTFPAKRRAVQPST